MSPWRVPPTIASALVGLLVSAALYRAPSSFAADAAPSSTEVAGFRVPYDGVGRYTMAKDDGLRGIQGLVELATRFGVKPYRDLQPIPYDGTWQSERVIFHDVDTGATLVRLTNDPWAETLSYFKGNWSADGQYIVFRRHPGMWENSTATHGPMEVRSDGTGLRNVFRQYPSIREHVCSPVTPNVCFAMADGNRLVPCDLKVGVALRPLRAGLGCWRLKISPDGKYLMGRSDISNGRPGLWIISVDGREYHEIAVPDSIHDSYQFHPSEKKVMFWYEGRFGTDGFVQCDFDGQQMTRVPVQFDWNHGDTGLDRGAHTNGYITRIRGDGWSALQPLFSRPGVEYYDDPCHYNGYLTWMPKDRPWVYATRIPDPPYLSEIQSFPAAIAEDGVANRFRICYTGLRRGNALDNPDASPDGTKVLFNSNMFGPVNVYYAVARLPERPTELKAERVPDGILLSWKPPPHHAEVAGYHVFRNTKSGVGFLPATFQPIKGTRVLDRRSPKSEPPLYAVTSVEYSGLESTLSDDATPENGRATQRTVFVEAEDAACKPRLWRALDGRASDLHYLWMRDRQGKGQARLTVELPRLDRLWHIWGRVKGQGGVQFAIAGGKQSASLIAPRTDEWRWLPFHGTLAISGKCELSLSSTFYGSAIDCLAFSTDADFSPIDVPRIRWPPLTAVSNLKAKVTSPYTVCLSWQPTDAKAFHHYNVYCSHQPNASPRQRDLIASPDRATFCDWGLATGQTIHYRVTCVDRAGNESAPSASTPVTLPAINRIVLRKAPAKVIDLDLPAAGTYAVWLRLKYRGGGDQYITVAMDGRPAMTWTCSFDGTGNEAWFSYDQWGRFRLAAGPHRLAIDNRTPHALESVLITNDLSYRPEGHVNSLSGW